MKRITIISLLALMVLGAQAQTANDALVIGQQNIGGSARYMSMAGAFNALGGDFSTLSVNPAGLGVYRSSEFTLTGDLNFNATTAEIRPNLSSPQTSTSDMKANVNLQNLGYVINTQLNSSGLISLNFGLGYNRLKNYHRSYRAEAFSSPHSLTDNWANSINGNGLNGATTGAYVADQAYLLNTVRNGDNIFDAKSPLLNGASVDYVKDVVEKGRVNEWVFSVGGNYDHRVYFGATFGIQNIKMEKDFTQTEYFLNIAEDGHANDGESYLRYESATTDRIYMANDEDYFNYNTLEKTEGFGLQAKFGVIVRPIDMLRIGVAVHTPSVNFLTVNQSSELYNNTWYFDDFGNEGAGETGYEELNQYEYRTLSPYKVHLSAGVTLGKRLALDAEVEMVDYSSMRIMGAEGRTSTYESANDAIKAMYKTAYNTRLGAEYKLLPSLAVRAGLAYTGSAFDTNIYYNNNSPQDAADYVGDRYTYSLGFGYRAGDFFLDCAYVLNQQSGRTFVFDDAIDVYEFDEMDLSQTLSQFMMTVGMKF